VNGCGDLDGCRTRSSFTPSRSRERSGESDIERAVDVPRSLTGSGRRHRDRIPRSLTGSALRQRRCRADRAVPSAREAGDSCDSPRWSEQRERNRGCLPKCSTEPASAGGSHVWSRPPAAGSNAILRDPRVRSRIRARFTRGWRLSRRLCRLGVVRRRNTDFVNDRGSLTLIAPRSSPDP